MKNNKLLSSLLDLIDNNKGENIVTLDLTDKSYIADYMIIVTASSTQHATSMAKNTLFTLKSITSKESIQLHSTVDGLNSGNWIAVDFESIILHIFRQEVRDYYNLEAIWQE